MAAHTVLIADSQPLMVIGIRRTLERHPDIEVVGEARSLAELLATLERRRPQVAIVDAALPGASGASAVEQVVADWPQTAVIVLGRTEDPPAVEAALLAGARAYVTRSIDPPQLSAIVAGVASGEEDHPRLVIPPRRAAAPLSRALTERERTILAEVTRGRTTPMISQDLWISQHTIKFHLTNIYRKLGVRNRAAAVRYAMENGIQGYSPG